MNKNFDKEDEKQKTFIITPTNKNKNSQLVLYKLTIEILNKNENSLSKKNFNIESKKLLNIKVDPINCNDLDLAKKEEYQEVYSLNELKNMTNNILVWNNIYELKNSFLESIRLQKYELFQIKKILLLVIEIMDSFNNSGSINFILKSFDSIKDSSLNKDQNYNLNDIELKEKNIKKREKNNNYTFLCQKRLFKTLNNDKEENSNDKCNLTNIGDAIDKIINKIYPKIPSGFDKNGLIEESHIIYNEEEMSLINNEIRFGQKLKKYKLLFRAKRDGDSAKIFHSLCDKYNNIIVLIETKQGLRFGGYTSVKFGGTAHLKKDNKAFLFSLDNKKIYKIDSNKYAIYCYSNSGPCFSYGSLYIPNNFFRVPGKTGKICSPYKFSFDFELNNGKEYFMVNELEIFQVIIEGRN